MTPGLWLKRARRLSIASGTMSIIRPGPAALVGEQRGVAAAAAAADLDKAPIGDAGVLEQARR